MTIFTAAMRTVYFMRPVGQRGPIKIGCSKHPDRRRAELGWVFGGPLEIAATMPGSIDDEHRIQSLFWHDHTRGEWFNWSPILQLVIDAVNRGEFDLDGLPPTRVRAMPHRRQSNLNSREGFPCLNATGRCPPARSAAAPPSALE